MRIPRVPLLTAFTGGGFAWSLRWQRCHSRNSASMGRCASAYLRFSLQPWQTGEWQRCHIWNGLKQHRGMLDLFLHVNADRLALAGVFVGEGEGGQWELLRAHLVHLQADAQAQLQRQPQQRTGIVLAHLARREYQLG
mgnify:CR=1 FL=1